MTTSRGRGGWGWWCCASSPHRPVGPGGSGSRSAGQVGGVVADAGGLGHGVVLLGLLQEVTAPRPVRLSGELSGSSGFLLVVADGLLAAHVGLLPGGWVGGRSAACGAGAEAAQRLRVGAQLGEQLLVLRDLALL